MAPSFPELIELAKSEQATHVTFGTERAGVLYLFPPDTNRLVAVAAFYHDGGADMWVMTDWLGAVSDWIDHLNPSNDGFFPISEAVEQQARLKQAKQDEA